MAGGYRVEIQRTRRQKTIGIQVRPGVVVLRCPAWVSTHQIDRVLHDRAPWIQAKLEACRQVALKPLVADPGAVWPIRGQSLVLTLESGPERVFIRGDALVVQQTPGSQSPVVSLLDDFLKQSAAQYLRARVAHWSAVMEVNPSQVKFRRYRARWGSCSASGVVSFHWPIIQAPDWVSDYLVVHELAHLRHFDHSKAFWQTVSAVIPDWKTARQWLKTDGLYLLHRPD